MANIAWKRNFFETTRGQLVRLLCGGARTVSELAEQLRISENAVRSHLATLAREDLVHLSGKQPGTRKPHFSYELTLKAHQLFGKGYEPVLLVLLDVLSRHETPDDLNKLALEAGRRFVQMYLPKLKRQKPAARLKTLVNQASNAAVPLAVVHEDGDILIRGCSCPLTTVINRRPELCDVIAALLSETLELPVERQCEHGQAPRCAFRLSKSKTFRAAKSVK